jgi:branched-subunit amino acid permease
MDANRNASSIGDILGGLARDVQALVRGEIALARTEFEQKLHRLIAALIWVLGGALVGFAGLVVLLQGGAAALALRLPAWAALLIVGALIIVVGALIARLGLSRVSFSTLTPERTADSLRKDARMIKEHTP